MKSEKSSASKSKQTVESKGEARDYLKGA